MADLNPISSKIKSLHDVYSSISGMKTTQTSISESLDNVSKQIETAIDGISAASSDTQATQAKSCLILANDAVKRVKTCLNSDLTALFGNCDEVEDLAKKILDKIEEGKSWNPGWWEKVWNDIIGFFCDEWRSGDSAKIAQANKEIDRWNKKGEDQLNAMYNAINSVKFGVIGNMTVGGALGASVAYSDNYSFNPDEWETSHPEVHYNFLTNLGCVTVGVASSVFKLAEGVVDTVALLAADVVSIFGRDASNIKNFIKKDHIGDFVESVMGNWSGYNPDAVKVGYLAGDFIVGKVLRNIPGAGLIVRSIYSLGMAGQAAEMTLNQTDNLAIATGASLVTGASSFLLTKGPSSGSTAVTNNPALPVEKTTLALPAGEQTLALPAGEQALGLPAAGKTILKALKDGTYLLSDKKTIVDALGNVVKVLD